MKTGKQKRKVYFVLGNGSYTTEVAAPGDKRVESTWNPGRSKNRFNKKRQIQKSTHY